MPHIFVLMGWMFPNILICLAVVGSKRQMDSSLERDFGLESCFGLPVLDHKLLLILPVLDQTPFFLPKPWMIQPPLAQRSTAWNLLHSNTCSTLLLSPPWRKKWGHAQDSLLWACNLVLHTEKRWQQCHNTTLIPLIPLPSGLLGFPPFKHPWDWGKIQGWSYEYRAVF